MKYIPQDKFNRTSCKECIFAIYNDNTQTGCMADRISKFKPYVIEAYDDDKEFFVVNRICNLYRTHNWNGNVADLDKAKEEVAITFDILIDCDNITDDYVNTIKSELINLKYPNNKIKIYLFQSSQSTKEEKHKAFALYQDLKNAVISIYFNKIDYIYGILQNTKNTFHIIIDSNNATGIGQLITTTNDLIVNNLTRFLVCKNDNKILISNMVLKIMYQNLYFDYENILSSLIENTKKENLYIEL